MVCSACRTRQASSTLRTVVRHTSKLVTQRVWEFRITRVRDDLTRDDINCMAGYSCLHGFARFFDGRTECDKPTLDFDGRFGFTFAQYITNTLNIRAVTFVFDSKVKVDDMAVFDPDIRRSAVSKGGIWA